MCSNFRSVSQLEWLSVDELVDGFWREARLEVTNKIGAVKTATDKDIPLLSLLKDLNIRLREQTNNSVKTHTMCIL